MPNPMVTDLVERLATETQAAIDHKASENDNDTPKVPEFHRAMGAIGRTLAINLSDESLAEAGLSKGDITKARDVGKKLRDWYVSQYGESTGGFDSKRGTTIVQSLKSFQTMASQGVFDLDAEDQTVITQALEAWYANAPLRGRASKVKLQSVDTEAA